MSAQLLVLSDPKPERLAEYLGWYEQRHLSDMMQVAGVEAGTLCELLNADDSGWRVASLYQLAAPVPDVLADIFARAGGVEMPVSDAMDVERTLMLAIDPLGPRRLADQGADQLDTLHYIVLTNCTAGDQQAFNSWYDERHIPDVFAIPGFIAAQRFRVAGETAGRASPWEFLSIYEIDPVRVADALGELGARAGTDAMPLSPTLDTGSVYARVYKVLREAQN